MGLFNNFNKEEDKKEEQNLKQGQNTKKTNTQELIEEIERQKVLIKKAEDIFEIKDSGTGVTRKVMGYEELFDVILGISVACRIDDIILSTDFPISFEKSGVEPLVYKFIEPNLKILEASYKNRPVKFQIALKLVIKTLRDGYRIILTKEATDAFKEIILNQPDIDNQKFKDHLLTKKQVDLSYVLKRDKMMDVRYRVNIAQKFSDEGISYFIVMRFVKEVQTLEELKLPDFFKDMALTKSGLVIWASPTGSGKSTTMAAVIDYARKARPIHIITLEDPIEFVHKTELIEYGIASVINQREVGVNVNSFSEGIKSAMREKPHIILVGEIRDQESMQAAFEAALTGHLVLTTIHSSDTMEAINRIINFFPEATRDSARIDLSKTLTAIVAQRLVKTVDGGRTLALEVLKNIPAIANNIKMNNLNEINSVMQTGVKKGLITLDNSLKDLVDQGRISLREALINAKDQSRMIRQFNITEEEARSIIEGATLSEIRAQQQAGNKNKKKGIFG